MVKGLKTDLWNFNQKEVGNEESDNNGPFAHSGSFASAMRCDDVLRAELGSVDRPCYWHADCCADRADTLFNGMGERCGIGRNG